MKDIGRADYVLVVVNKKYVQSVYCMRELLYLFQTSLGEREVFLPKPVPLTLDECSNFESYRSHRSREVLETAARRIAGGAADLDHASVSPADRTELLFTKDFQHHVSEMPGWVGIINAVRRRVAFERRRGGDRVIAAAHPTLRAEANRLLRARLGYERQL